MFPLSSVLAGPIVRRVDPESASVWMALSESATVRLQVCDMSGSLAHEGVASTVAIGQKLHIVLVSATGPQNLLWGQCYLYELTINGQPLEVDTLLYSHGPSKLSFVLPAATLQDTSIIHGSCRQPTDRGIDALALLDDLVARSFQGPHQRPQIFGCTGDLIYADSPSPGLLKMVGRLGDELLGYREALPGLDCSASEIPLEDRQTFVRDHARIYDAPARQLFGLGEYLALHLLVLSPTLWPAPVPEELERFRSTLPKVRRALANTSFYAIFDDHEITDDWYLTRAWAERVLSSPLGRRMVCNGLSAFALVHAWGNQPENFSSGKAGRRIVDALCRQSPPDAALERDLGMPTEVADGLHPPRASLPWHFRLHTPAVDLRSLDTRTMRAYPSSDPHGPCDLLSEEALAAQLSELSDRLLVLLVPAPMAPPPRTKMEDFGMRTSRRFSSSSAEVLDVYRPDCGDEWAPTSAFYQKVLDRLPDRWVCLGGDTHLAYAAALRQERGRSAIFCSSGMQRETRMRLIRQRMGFAFPWPWSRTPEERTARLTLTYLRSEKSASGTRFQYLSKNNIGELRFDHQGASLSAHHTLWWRDGDELSAVVHKVPLSKDPDTP